MKYKRSWKPPIYNMKKHIDSISCRLKYILLKYILLSKCFVKWVLTWYNSRSLGHSAPLLPAPAEGPGALWALLGAFGPLFITIKLYFESEFPFLGGLFYKTFWFEASLYMFLIFWNFRGSFLSLIFGFWKFWNCILNQNSHFLGGLFYETFWFEASLSTSDDFIDSSGIIFLVPFLATKETLAPLANDPIM